MKVGEEHYWRLDGINIPSSKTRTKMLTSFESHQFDLIVFATRFEPAKRHDEIFVSEMLEHFLVVLLCFAKIFREICVEKYKEFNGGKFSLTRARTKVLASFESQ